MLRKVDAYSYKWVFHSFGNVELTTKISLIIFGFSRLIHHQQYCCFLRLVNKVSPCNIAPFYNSMYSRNSLPNWWTRTFSFCLMLSSYCQEQVKMCGTALEILTVKAFWWWKYYISDFELKLTPMYCTEARDALSWYSNPRVSIWRRLVKVERVHFFL